MYIDTKIYKHFCFSRQYYTDVPEQKKNTYKNKTKKQDKSIG